MSLVIRRENLMWKKREGVFISPTDILALFSLKITQLADTYNLTSYERRYIENSTSVRQSKNLSY